MLSLEDVRSEGIDVFVAACGYEGRAWHVAALLAPTETSTIVLDYESFGILQYDLNRSKYAGLQNATFVSLKQEGLEDRILRSLEQAKCSLGSNRGLNVLFDASSCSRRVIARVSVLLRSVVDLVSVVNFAYAPAKYYSPPTGELPSHISEPVIGDLSGWSDDLSKPPCAIIGLGFEPGRALGCIDYLEIPTVRIFMPQGPDFRFIEHVVKANESLLDEVGRDLVFDYDILDPARTYEKLESLVFGLMSRYRPVIIPLGPKIFSVISIQLAIELMPAICVWRTSSGDLTEPKDIDASGEVAVFRVSPYGPGRGERGPVPVSA
jgi:hypothetical protein